MGPTTPHTSPTSQSIITSTAPNRTKPSRPACFSTRTMIGSVAIKALSRQHRLGEIGWTLSRKYQRFGYAAEAGNAILRFGFDQLDLFWVISFCHVRNVASYQLMERLGMRRLAHFERNKRAKSKWWDAVVYSITEPEWRLVSASAGTGTEPHDAPGPA